MRKLLLILMPFLFVLAVNAGHADAVPDIRGEYSGSYTTVVSNCTDSSLNGTYYAVLAMNISTQTGDMFSGSATGTFKDDGLTATEYIQLTGTITESGQISGKTSHTFLGTGGEGTFTGQLSGNTLSIENPGHDTYGETCTYTRYMSAIRAPHELIIWPSDPADKDHFGVSVSISGGYTIVGAHNDDDNGEGSGSAYVFERSGNNWNQTAKLTASDGAFGDNFGGSVSISGGYAIVGAHNDDDNGEGSGSAYVFERSGNSWNQVAKLTASDGSAHDNFGTSVSISGDHAIVGSMYDDDKGDYSGSAYVFERSGDSWNQVAKLTASDGSVHDNFGVSVSISGNYAIVGAEGYPGSAYVFERSGNNWNQAAKLTASDGFYDMKFGKSVSIYGDSAIVGAYLGSGNKSKSGSAYMFERSGDSWNQVAKLTASDGAAGDLFGESVSISGDHAIVGAHYDDGDNGTNSGSAYVFERSGNNWNQMVKLTARDGEGGYHSFGYSVSIFGDSAIVGAYKHDGNGESSGAAYIYDFSSFTDVPPGYWAEEFIYKIYENGITSGCSQDPIMYCPEDPVTRAEMAVFLERGINGSDYEPPGATGIFDDCPVSYWAADWVEQFYADGITSGCSTDPPLYCPDDLVTRAEMAVFLLRSMYGNGYTPPSAVGIFDDVPVIHWAANWIEALYDEGISGGCSTDPPLYCPDDLVTRAEMAVFIVRAFDL